MEVRGEAVAMTALRCGDFRAASVFGVSGLGAVTVRGLDCRVVALEVCGVAEVDAAMGVGGSALDYQAHSIIVVDAVGLPERARSGNVEEPWIDALRVELVVARKNTDVLAFDEVVRTH